MDSSSVLTLERLRKICPRAASDILEAVLSGAPSEFGPAGLTDGVHVAHFLAQIAAETLGLSRLDENLFYTTAARLRQVFKVFKSDEEAKPFLRNPEALANKVYAHKNGNSNPGDGWTYRGSGLIQITGRGNFKTVEDATGIKIVADPELARHPDSALTLALAFWKAHKISDVADEPTDAAVQAVTKRINPALQGLADRQTYFRAAMKALKPPTPVAAPAAAPVRSPARPLALAPSSPADVELSGSQWVPRYPTSQSIADLAAPFSKEVETFVSAMKAGGAEVRISATYRPRERAYLMHWAWMIAKGGLDPDHVPPMPGVGIRWGHPTPAQSRAAARAMVKGYGMVQVAALNSRHTERRAIDMTITWQGQLDVRQLDGSSRTIASQPRNGSNKDLIAVGRAYGVIKLATDPPHWSDDGR